MSRPHKPARNVTALQTHKCSAPHEHFACRVRRVDGHPLPIDELKGTKPTEKIDLSGKGLGVASAIIIASCIKDNGSLNELRYGAHLHTIPHSMSAPAEHFFSARSLAENRLCGVWTERDKFGERQKGNYTAEGITALCEGLKGSAVTSLT